MQHAKQETWMEQWEVRHGKPSPCYFVWSLSACSALPWRWCVVYLHWAHRLIALCKHHQCLNPVVLIGLVTEKLLPGPQPQPTESESLGEDSRHIFKRSSVDSTVQWGWRGSGRIPSVVQRQEPLRGPTPLLPGDSNNISHKQRCWPGQTSCYNSAGTKSGNFCPIMTRFSWSRSPHTSLSIPVPQSACCRNKQMSYDLTRYEKCLRLETASPPQKNILWVYWFSYHHLFPWNLDRKSGSSHFSHPIYSELPCFLPPDPFLSLHFCWSHPPSQA